MRSALSWSLENEPETALRLAVALARFWERRVRFVEGSAWLEAVLRLSDGADTAVRARLSSEAGTFAFHRADFDHAIELHGEALELYRQVGDDSGVAFALRCLGAQYFEKGDPEQAAPFLEEALIVSRGVGTTKHRRHPPQPRGSGAPEGQLRAGKESGHGGFSPGTRDGGQEAVSHDCRVGGIAGGLERR